MEIEYKWMFIGKMGVRSLYNDWWLIVHIKTGNRKFIRPSVMQDILWEDLQHTFNDSIDKLRQKK